MFTDYLDAAPYDHLGPAGPPEQAAAGATNLDIAETMVLTRRTVERYLTSVYRKLGISGRCELRAAQSA